MSGWFYLESYQYQYIFVVFTRLADNSIEKNHELKGWCILCICK